MRDAVMMAPDIWFNLGALVLDALVISMIVRPRPAPRPWVRGVTGVLLPVAYGAVGLIVAGRYHLRIFGLFRFIGMAMFWHLPVLLVIGAARAGGRRRAVMVVAAASLAGAYVYAYHVEPYWLEVTRYSFTHPLLARLERPVVIAQVSDLQPEVVGPYERLVIRTLADLRPDLILFTGDYAQGESRAECEAAVHEVASLLGEARIAPPLGAYAVTGDFDTSGAWVAPFERAGVRVLDDRTVVLRLPGCPVNLTGLSVMNSRTDDPADLARAFAGRSDAALDLVFGHAPDFASVLARAGRPFLALAGHTHGGQVRLPLVGPPITLTRLERRFAHGFLPFGPGTLSVSRGIGVERFDAPRLRFLCRPEIRLITLAPPSPAATRPGGGP